MRGFHCMMLDVCNWDRAFSDQIVAAAARSAVESNKCWNKPIDTASQTSRWAQCGCFLSVSRKETDHGANSLTTEKPCRRAPWNKGKLVGARPHLRPSHVWSIRTKLQIEGRKRDLALFNLAIDSKLRGCDVVAVRVDDVAPGGYAMDRATIRQKKTGRPVRFELTDQTRMAIDGI